MSTNLRAPLFNDAGFRWTESGQDYLHHLGAKLRLPMGVDVAQQVFGWESADRTTIRRVSIGSNIYDLMATIRYDGMAQSLADFIAAARRGVDLVYFPSLSAPSESYPCVLMEASAIRPDDDFAIQQRWACDVRLRRTDGGTWQGLIEGTLFYYKAGNPAPGLTFTRTGVAYALDEDGIYQSTAANIFRTDFLESGPVLVLEAAATNDLLDSADLDVGDANWTFGGAAWTTATTDTPAISGGVAVRYTNDGATGSHSVYQATPNLVASPVAVSTIVEQVDATLTEWGLYDNTAGDWVVRARYTWATGVASLVATTLGSAQSVEAEVLRAVGPNGGQLVRLTAIATADNAGNVGRFFIYPTGTGTNTESLILHHGQHEDGGASTSPIVTAGTAVTRNVEILRASYEHPAQEMTVYIRFREAGNVDNSAVVGLLKIGSATSGEAPRLLIFTQSNEYRALYETDGGAITLSGLTTAPSFGEWCELRVVLTDSALTLGQSIEEGAETTDTGAHSLTLGTWAGELLYLNSRGSSASGLAEIDAVKIIAGTKTMAEMRAL